MLFITYNQNSNGRSGHALCDIFTTFVFSELLNMEVIYNNTWENQKILSKEMFLKYSSNYKDYKYDYILDIDYIRKWECISYEDYIEIKNNILKLSKKYNNILLRLSNVCKIHPHIIYDWYLKKYIKNDIYHNKILPKLHKLYYGDNDNNISNVISIHIRCGDLNNQLMKEGFTFSYYKNIIDIINMHFNTKINVYCENINYSHLNKLDKLDNTTLYVGGIDNFSDDFNKLVNSKILILAPSSMSLFAGYLCKGLVLIDNKSYIWRKNIFNYSENIFEVFNNISDKIELMNKYL
tara:strand:- start:4827 stop:5708 length:882 start_codon:yes stop_codon:yes gene_type:complete